MSNRLELPKTTSGSIPQYPAEWAFDSSAEERMRWRDHMPLSTPNLDERGDPFNQQVFRSGGDQEKEKEKDSGTDDGGSGVGRDGSDDEVLGQGADGNGNGVRCDEEKKQEEREDERMREGRLGFKDRIRHFTWTWFTMTMATGGIANVLYTSKFGLIFSFTETNFS